jgi:PAS domain S-box-containing protein
MNRRINSKDTTHWEPSVRRLIGLVALLCGIAPFILFLIFTINQQKTDANARTEVLAHIITDQINKNPEYWQYEQLRFSAILRHNPYSKDQPELRQLIDNNGIVLAETGITPQPPQISVDYFVFDAGKPVGVLRITNSIRGILLKSTLVLAIGCVCSSFIFFILHSFPLRLLRSAFNTLSEEKEQATVTLDSIADGVITTDTEFNILSLNPAGEQLCGREAAQVIGKPFNECFRLVDPQTGTSVDRLMTECLQKAKGSSRMFEHALLNLSSDDTQLQVEITVSHLYDSDARLLGLVIVMHDLTVSLKMEKQLSNKAQELKHIVRYAGVGIAFIQNGIIRKANIIIAEIIGLPQEQIIGRPVKDILTDKLGYTGSIEEICDHLGEGNIFDVEHCVTRMDGKQIWLRLIGQSVDPAKISESGTVWIAQDISQLKRQQQLVEKAKAHAEETSRFKSELLAHTSHELRSPLSGIIGANRLVLDSELSQYQRQFLTIIDDAANSLLRLINNILDLSKIESGIIELERELFILQDVFNYVTNIVVLQAKEKGLSVTFAADENVPSELIGDQLRLSQVLLNLVSNSIKFTESGSVDVACKVISNHNNSIQLRFKITDTGCGINESARRKIFDAFVQASNSVARTHGGSGLGLSICKKLTELMGGDIWLDSEQGTGTTFTFTAWFQKNLQIDTNQSSTESESPEQSDLTQHRCKRILVVEDLAMNQTITKLLLESDNHQVMIAANGREALLALRDAKYDAIFMDIQMPEMDGLTATKIIRRCENDKHPQAREDTNIIQAVSKKIHGCHIPIIGMTGNATEEGRRECFNTGMDGCISKPFDQQEMLQALRLVLRDNENEKPA